MFGIDTGELMVIALVALVVIGPKDLPRVMRTVGRWVGQARGMARHFRSGFDAMIRESELEDMERKWREDNERIMRMHPPKPPSSGDSDWGKAEQVPAADERDKGATAKGADAQPAAPDKPGTANGKPAPMRSLAPPRPRIPRGSAPPVPRRAAPRGPDGER